MSLTQLTPRIACGTPRDSLRVVLVDLCGETNIRYVPLACLCLKAYVDADAELRDRVQVVTVQPPTFFVEKGDRHADRIVI